MNAIRRNIERQHIQSGTSEMWLTFHPQDPTGSLDEGFGLIAILNESLLPPFKKVLAHMRSETDLFTYVYKGALALVGPKGHLGSITAGEYQCMTIGSILSQEITSTSDIDHAHFFRIFLRLLSPQQHWEVPPRTQARFTKAQRHNILCVVASIDERNASLRIHSDAHIYSSILDKGQHIVHELLQGRKAWLHIVYGKVSINADELSLGDGMGFADVPSISLTATESAELLLIDTISDSILLADQVTANNGIGA